MDIGDQQSKPHRFRTTDLWQHSVAMQNYFMSATAGPKNFIHNFKLYPELYKYCVLVYKMKLFAKFRTQGYIEKK